MAGQDSDMKNQADPKLVGEALEVSILVNGIATTALCDTGSCVSTCSEQFYNDHLQNIELKPLSKILKIECADGNVLPYKGYIESSLKACGIPENQEQKCLLLVVPNTQYNNTTPILLGTNILTELRSECKGKLEKNSYKIQNYMFLGIWHSDVWF